MGVPKKQRWRRDRLFAQHPYCHWCRCKLIHPSEALGAKGRLPKGGPPRNMATLDHLDSKLSGRRGKRPNEVRTVLSCWECNLRRGAEEVAALNIEELHRRTQQAGQLSARVWQAAAAAEWPLP